MIFVTGAQLVLLDCDACRRWLVADADADAGDDADADGGDIRHNKVCRGVATNFCSSMCRHSSSVALNGNICTGTTDGCWSQLPASSNLRVRLHDWAEACAFVQSGLYSRANSKTCQLM